MVTVTRGPMMAAAEAVAGEAAGPAVLHLVDCSLLVPPRAGADGRARYSMLETLRGYGARLLAEAGEQDQAAAALAAWALSVAEQAAAGMTTIAGESRLPPGGWMPRTPPWAACWPGRWDMTWTWLGGW
jgi:hypothetical protein